MEENKEIKDETTTEKEIPTKDEEEVVEEVIEEENPEAKLKEEIDNLTKEVSRLKNAYAKAYADTENVKKRLNSEAQMSKKYRIQSFALEILPVIDNLERALKASENQDDPLRKGVEMVYNQLVNALKNEGVEEIDCENKEFDPSIMQSIMVEKKDGVKANTVIEVLQKGYMLKDRVLRASMVKISE